ncbi:MAG: sugar ABC transporter ATP-binding protein, partial [Acidobacteria bacterium]|nr:sugar ABC transporter ATP-binding protein [Acidobacteriota bacterium]
MSRDPRLANPDVLVRMRAIGKAFGAAPVLDDVSFDVRAGEVHLLAGENGAGKSTLMKILAGVYADFGGSVEFATGVTAAVIYQELSLVPSMSVMDNLLLGRAPSRFGFLLDGAAHVDARRLLEMVRLDVVLNTPVGALAIGQQQLVEIAKALGRNARIIVMDEPTSALAAAEVETLFQLIGELKARGCGIVYITHRMEEVYRIADRITVLRDGRHVVTAGAQDLPAAALIEAMVGRKLDAAFPTRSAKPGTEVLRLPGGAALHTGEILGIAGLEGCGATELLSEVFRTSAVRTAYVTNDRKTTGLVLSMSVAANITLASLRWTWRDHSRERQQAHGAAGKLRIKSTSLDNEVGELSGGNQQKVVLAKWLLTQPRVMLLDEPTRGIDIGAKYEIYQLLEEWTAQGM